LPGRVLGTRPPEQPAADETYAYDPTVGLDSLGFDPWTALVTDDGDHNGDDARSLCFTSEPLAEDWELTGQARLVVSVRVSVPGLQFVGKLCDVHAGGRSRLVTMGWSPDPAAEAGAVHEVTIPLRATSHVFRKGHRLRIGLALADFPRLWPTPRPGEIALAYDPARPPRLLLPRTPPQAPALPAPAFPPPGPALRSPFEVETTQTWRVGRELVRREAALESGGRSEFRLRAGGTVTYRHEYTASVTAADPAGTAITVRSEVEVRRPADTVLVKAASVFTPESVTVQAEIERDGKVIFRREWKGARAHN
jgi:hypothetical protein